MSHTHEIVCRCEEVTREEILAAIAAGDATLDAIKKRTRAGMGFCQGRTCRRLTAQILSAVCDIPLAEALQGSVRVPVGPLSLGLIADTEDGLEEPDHAAD